VETDNIGQQKNVFPGEIKGDLCRFDSAESRCGNQHPLASTTFKGERFKVKNYILVKKGVIFLKLLYTVQNVKTVSVYNILPKNK
jgi:hypothetical protein